MNLTYRGHSYRPSLVSMSGMDTGLKARFRGIHYRFIATRCEAQYESPRRSFG